MFRLFLFYFILLLFIASPADTLIVPQTQLTAKLMASLTKPTASQIIVSQTRIQESGAKTVSDLLQNIGGIATHASDNPEAPLLSMRGFGDNGNLNTVILLNGFPLENPDTASVYLDQIPIASIKNIEITPASSSVLYGDGAVGGVLNIITEKPKHFMAGVRLGAGSYDGNSQDVYVGNQIKHFYYFVDVNKLRTDNNRAHNTLNENNGLLNLGYQGEETQTDFSYHDNTENQQYPGSLQLPNSNETAFTHYHLYLLQVKHWLDDNWQLDNNLGYNNSNTSGYLGSDFTQKRQGVTLMPKLIGTLPFANILTSSGITATQEQYKMNAIYDNVDDNVNDTDNTTAAYTQWTIPIKEFYSVALGANAAEQSVDLNNLNGDHHAFVTEQAFNYDPNSEWRLYLRRAGTYRFPKADETGEENQILNTQTGNSYETGFAWTTLKSLLQMQVYLIDLNNEIAYAASNPSEPADQADRNLDPTRRLGFLTHAHYKLTSLVTLYGDCNFVDPYYRSGPFAGNTIPLVSKETANLGISYQFRPRWQVYLASLYSSSSYAAGDDLNQNHLGGYTVFNTNLNYIYKAWEVAFKINNLLNKQYSTYTVFSPYDSSLFSDYPAPGRNYWVTVSYALN